MNKSSKLERVKFHTGAYEARNDFGEKVQAWSCCMNADADDPVAISPC